MNPNKRILLMTGLALAVVAASAAGIAAAHAGGFSKGWLGHARGTLTDGTIPGFTATDGAVETDRLALTADVANGILHDVTLKDGDLSRLLFASASLALADGATPAGGVVDARLGGYALTDGAGTGLVIREGIRGGLQARSVNGSVLTLVLPSDATVVVHEAVESWSPAGATVTYADGSKANLVLRNATIALDGDALVVTLEEDGTASYGFVTGEHGYAKPHGYGFGHGGRRGHR